MLYDDVEGMGVSGPTEVFSTASTLGGRGGEYRIRTASVGGTPVRTSSGLVLVPDFSLEDGPSPQTLVIPGSGGLPNLGADVVTVMGEAARSSARVMALGTGAFLLAEASMLSGRRATTHWQWCGLLAERFPDVEVDAAAHYVKDEHIATAGGGTSGIDLALSIVEDDAGLERALETSRQLVTFLRRPGDQLQFAQWAVPPVEDPALRETLAWISNNLDGELSSERMASHARMSLRHFSRLFTAQTGISPRRYVELVRVEAVRRMLEKPEWGTSMEVVSQRAGFGTSDAMRKSFSKVLHVEPAQYQERFS
ncbi:GlxA family transcriptional regulator [Streptomyces tubercidicus]|uniref:GlxA family transcriptional regulator n=1 Tax=Streptomyces tubercidicus TaxID=47759 RepID=UPI0034662EFF